MQVVVQDFALHLTKCEHARMSFHRIAVNACVCCERDVALVACWWVDVAEHECNDSSPKTLASSFHPTQPVGVLGLSEKLKHWPFMF